MDPIRHLLDEHQLVMAQVADLRQAVADLEAFGEAALPEALPVLARIGRMMETQLARHARKEDEALFPAVEAALGALDGPTAIMRQEHRDIHQQGELLRQTLHALNQVEHPRLEAGGENLRRLAASGGSAVALRGTAAEIIHLLDQHFGKEETILFPMAVAILDEPALAQVARRMQELAL